MKKHFKWLAAFLIVATLFGGILGCKQVIEVPIDYTAPADVTSLTVQAANGNAVLNWKNPADADFAGVQISMSPAEGTLKNAVILGKEVTSLDVSGLENGKEYTFTVKAFDKTLNYSEGAEEKATVADTADYTAPADVTELTATNKDASVLLTWIDATDEDIYGYEVTWNKNVPINRSAAMDSNSMMVAPGAKGCYISNLINGTEYAFTVKSVDTSGNKSAGVTKTITPSIIEKSALQIALEPNTTERTNKDVVITVNATTDSASEIKQITYIEGTVVDIDTVLKGTDITDIRQITATENTTCTVVALDTAGRRELAFITVSNIDKEAPAQITNIESSFSKATNIITLSWTNPTDEDFVGTEITYGKTGSEEVTTIELAKDKTSFEIETTASENDEYNVSIKTKDSIGNISEPQTIVASTRAKITSISLDRIHLDTIIESRDIVVTIKGSNFDQLESLLVQVFEGTSGQTPVTAVIDKETNTATATVIAPIPSTPTDEGTTYTLKAIVDSITPADVTASFVVSNPTNVTSITLDKSQLKVGSTEKVTATVKGYNFDIAGEIKVKVLDSLSNEIASIEVPAIENSGYTEFSVILPISYEEGYYSVIVFFDDVIEPNKKAGVLHVYGETEVESVKIPVASTSYGGNILPVTIYGKNFTSPNFDIKSLNVSGITLSNITVATDRIINGEITCPYIAGTTSVKVAYGSTSATTDLNVEVIDNPFKVGDILFTDGTRIGVDNNYAIPDSQLEKAFAVIASAPYGGATGLALGLQKKKSEIFSPEYTLGSEIIFENTICIPSESKFDGSALTATFIGDLDGSDNWEEICKLDPSGTEDAETNYPTYYFVNNYGTTAGLTGTEYETGWYLPSIVELCAIWRNKDTVQTILDKVDGFYFDVWTYRSSSQVNRYGSELRVRNIYGIKFGTGYIAANKKFSTSHVAVVQNLHATDFEYFDNTPVVTSIEDSTVGEGYTGELPVTIIGKNLKDNEITCSDSSFGNVTYISDTKATATIHYDGSNNTIIVTSGTSSATGTVKVVAAEKCYSVGDILFTDGTRIKAENVQYGVPDSQLSKAFAVIASAPYGGGVGKAVGLQRSSSTLKWAPRGTTGYNTTFTGIQADYSGSSSSGYTFSGNIDGSDNWEYICSIDPEGTKDTSNNYPAFNFALTYGTQAGLTGTDYENSWYVPSFAELYDVYTNKEVVQTSLTAVGGFTLGTSVYWSGSQYASLNSNINCAYQVSFNYGYVYAGDKNFNDNVFVLQAFNVEQFNNYEYGTPSITSVTANAGEGYTGELPVTITGTNLKGYEITCSDSSFGNVTYISDTKATATIHYDGSNNTITVTSGTSSATGTVKVVAAEKCYSVGDILFTDGTRIKAENVQYGVPDSQLDKAFAVVASAPYGGVVGKAVGLQRSATKLFWAPSGTTGYNTKFTNIICTPSETGSGAALTATFTGDTDGSDNWEEICAVDPEGTSDAATNYPVFNFANTYGTTAGLTGTDYENGWYVPSIAELCEVYKNKEVINTSLNNAAGGFTFGTSWYWSSSQSASYDYNAYQVDFDDGPLYDNYKNNDDSRVLVLQAFNVEQFNNYEVTPSITSVTINPATVGEGYTGELSVTIIGENLKGHAITSNDASFGNVTYLSDTKATATITCNGIVGENTITVTSGESSATGTLKVLAAENCFSVGDILFTDGTRIKAENVQYGIPDSQLSKAFAVIASAPYGGRVGKAVGLQKSASTLMWASYDTTGYYTKFTGIQATRSGDSSSGYTFSGDIDGSDNWEYICSIDPEGTKNLANNYPAFKFALTYGTQAGLTGTEYETGWYVPSEAELYDVYTNKEVVQTSLNATGGFTLGTSYYWSSSQYAFHSNYAWQVDFNDGNVSNDNKTVGSNVLVLQAFNAEQFNNYEVTTIPNITSVTIANAGEGYTGELPVTIIGENLKGHAITCSDASFGNVNYVSDNMIKVTVNCNGIVGENAITVTSGESSATGTVKVVAVENCFSVGDIILTDGTKVSADDVATYTIDENNKPIGVIASTAYGGGVGKAVGLSSDYLMWAPYDTTGYSTNFTGIQADCSYSTSSGYTFSGDIDGSDNWEHICSIDPEGTKDAATNYPAFNFALTYGTQAGLTGTDYETGWYVPSVAELYDVYTNKEVVQTSLNAVGEFTLGTSYYWSSSQNASINNYAYQVIFYDGGVSNSDKDGNSNVFVLQAFNAEQFN